jgi:segregation and condensation protein A
MDAVARMSDAYQVQLDVFSGPLDLLLYLVRRDELDIQDVRIARVAEQYLDYVRFLEQLDPNAAGDFLVMAATLVELKSRAVLPTPPPDAADDDDDPRSVLVRQLLEYKRFKDAARSLGRAADDRVKRYVRRPAELPVELDGVELEEAEVWDLLSAFGRVMSSIGKGPTRYDISFDDTPIALYEAELLAALESDGPTSFQSLFEDRRERHEIVGLFLALLELIRQKRVSAEQDVVHGEIYLFLLDEVEDEVPGATPAPMRLVRDDDEGPDDPSWDRSPTGLEPDPPCDRSPTGPEPAEVEPGLDEADDSDADPHFTVPTNGNGHLHGNGHA